MTITTPAVPRTPPERLRWAVTDAWTVTGRDLAHWARQPAPVIVGLLFPVLMVVMFGYLFGGAMSVPDGGEYREFLLPGMFALIAVQVLVWPLGFLSNVFVATATMPGWLGTIAQWNPLSATVSATRELFGNPGVGVDGSWIAQHWLPMAIVWPLVLIAVFLPLSVRRYQRLRR